ncbi:MAG: molybdopterin-dependent oxidoreductase [Bacteroidales bacterium]|nr:molybdopterin-dependent oxidoreductase [Bacteroidales bacterium]
MANRRDFIKVSALGLGGLAMSAPAFNILKAAVPQDLISKDSDPQKGLRRFPTYCEVCFWKCAGWTYTDEDGRIIKILGHEEDPHCNGRLCPRGTGGIGMYYDKDRLTTPLIREGEPGNQTFRRASWDEAFGLIAAKMIEIKSKYGAESMALFNHGSSGQHFGHMLKAYGSTNIVAPSYAQCRGPREVGFTATFGSGVGSPEPTDIRDTRCLVLIGSHLGENMHNGQVQEMSDAIDKGASIITVDPRFSTAASKSKYWLPIKPATDMALLLAWIHVLIYEELYDKDYIERYSYGLDLLREHVKDMTPEWAYGITTIKPDVIRKTAREMAKAAPAAIIHPGRHVTWYGDDTQRSRAIAILNALLGSWGRRGGFYFKESMKLPNYPHPPYPKPNWSWRETMNGRYPLAGLAVSNALIDASIPDDDNKHRIHGWLVSGTNLPLTMPDKNRLTEAMQALDLLVVVDTMPMEITGYADVILPECTYLERYDDIRTSPHREPYLALRMPAAEPLGDSKPAWWMAKKLGEKLGLGEYFNYEHYTEVLDWQLKKVGSSLEEMKKTGIKKFDRKSGGLYLLPGEDYSFNTNTGKIELYSTELQAEGFDPMPVYTPHEEPPQGYYRLIYGRAPMHTFSRTANNPNLTDLMEENSCWINPKVAGLWRLKNKQYIWLKNQDGIVSDFPIQVRVTERIRWDSIYMVHGFGHKENRLSQAFGKGAADSYLITNVKIDPIMGGTGMRSNFVTFLTENPHEA